MVSVMLIAVRNIKLNCELHKTIKLNYKNTLSRVIVILRLLSTYRSPAADQLKRTRQGHYINMSRSPADAMDKYGVTDGVEYVDTLQYVDTPEDHTFRWPLSP